MTDNCHHHGVATFTEGYTLHRTREVLQQSKYTETLCSSTAQLSKRCAGLAQQEEALQLLLQVTTARHSGKGREKMKCHLVVEGVEVVFWVHGGLQPDLLRSAPETSPQGVACFSGKGGSSAQNMQRVILPVAQGGHIPGQLVQTSLNVLVVLDRRGITTMR